MTGRCPRPSAAGWIGFPYGFTKRGFCGGETCALPDRPNRRIRRKDQQREYRCIRFVASALRVYSSSSKNACESDGRQIGPGDQTDRLFGQFERKGKSGSSFPDPLAVAF